MLMSESEICASYRDAKNKAGQVNILAQLNATDPECIRDILKKNNILAGKRGPKPKASIPEQKNVPKMPTTAHNPAEAASTSFDKELSEKEPAEVDEAAVVPHIRVPLPPIVKQAIEDKLTDLDSKIKYHEEQLALLNHQYKEVVDYLNAEGKL